MNYLVSFLCTFTVIHCSAQVFEDLIPLDRPLGFVSDAVPLDMDNDGDKDFIFAEQESLFWIENLGDNQFGQRQGPLFTANNNILYLFTNDLDQDGDEDLQFGILNNPAFTMDNLDNGLLGTAQELNSVFGVTDVFLGDIKLDGTKDLITVKSSDSSTSIYRSIGNSNGTYEPVELLFTLSHFSRGIALKDLNGDGINDLVVNLYSSTTEENFSWFPGEENGDFDDAILIGSSSYGFMNIIDLDVDGDLDILQSGPDGVNWYVNNGNGYLINSTVYNIFTESATGSSSLPMADLDGDGDPDVCVETFDNKVIWLENDGSTNNWPIHSTNTSWSANLDLSDVDGDGFDDIITFREWTAFKSKVNYTINDGNGNLYQQWDVVYTALINGSLSADVNGDGLEDLVTSDFSWADGVYLYLNAGNGRIKTQKTLYVKNPGESPTSPRIRGIYDIDGDGDKDVVFGLSGGLIGWTENLGDDSFKYRGTMQVPISAVIHTTYFEDFNGDGIPDLLYVDDIIDDEVILYHGTEPGVYEFEANLHDDFGAFSRVSVADFDNDSDPDIVFFSSNLINESVILLNDGIGNFTPNNEFVATNNWSFLKDMDGDGDLDAFAFNKWFENDASLTFATTHYLSNVGSDGIHFSDIYDLDGDQDFDVFFYDGRVQRNIGYNTYTDPKNIINDEFADVSMVAITDSDGDGDSDILFRGASDTPIGENRLFLAVNIGNEEGCTDNSACNFDPEADFDDGSCCYTNCGCTNPEAENTNNTASCNDGTCEYEITGYVFRDINDSGDLDASDIGLAFERVLLLPDSIIFTTDEFGQFQASFTGDQSRVISIIKRDARDYMTTTSGYDIDVNDPNWTNPIYEFGFTEIEVDIWKVHSLKAGIESPGRNYSCNEQVIHEVFITNYGSSTINAIINVTLGSEFAGYEEIDNLLSLSDTEFRFTANFLEPGERRSFKVGIITPEENTAIQELEINAEVIGYHQGDLEVLETITKKELFNCSPENNIIDADPKGYTSEHYITGDELLRYSLEFQNNTASTIVNVILDNQLTEYLQLADLQIIDAGGLSYCAINIPEQTMTCRKENANLSPSSDNFNASFGHFVFEAMPKFGLTPGTVIDVSNDVVLDGSLATNGSYFHTIVDCDLFELTLAPTSLDLCIGEEAIVTASGDLEANLIWSYGGETIGNDENLIFNSFIPGENSLVLTSENPVCVNTDSIPVTITQTLFAEVDGDFDFCMGDSTTLSSNSPVDHEWTFNNEIVGSESSITLDESGELQLILSDGTCFSAALIIEIEEIDYPPAPIINIISDQLFTNQISDYEYQWFLEGELIPDATSNSFTPVISGSYSVEVTNSTGCSTISSIVVIVVGIDEIEMESIRLYPNPMTNSSILELGNLSRVSIIYIYDASGKIVRIDTLDKNNNTHNIKRGNLKPGSYYLTFYLDELVYKKPFIIQ